jgi:DNA primase
MKGLSPEAFRERIAQAKSSFFYELDSIKKEYDMNDPEAKTRFMNEVAKKCTSFDNEIERNNYIEAFAREYAVRVEDFRKLVAYHSAQMAGVNYERRRKEHAAYDNAKKDDGIAQSEGVFLTWITNDRQLYEKTKDIIHAEDFVDEPYHRVAEMIYKQYESQGMVEPAAIISRYESKEEQSAVAAIFNKEIRALTGDMEQQKAVNEVVRKIKKYSLEYRSRQVSDMKELQQIIAEKKQLQTLQIPF